jgi:hypothetical protein
MEFIKGMRWRVGCIVPPTQFLFGTDYSFETTEAPANRIPDFRRTKDVMDMFRTL